MKFALSILLLLFVSYCACQNETDAPESSNSTETIDNSTVSIAPPTEPISSKDYTSGSTKHVSTSTRNPDNTDSTDGTDTIDNSTITIAPTTTPFSTENPNQVKHYKCVFTNIVWQPTMEDKTSQLYKNTCNDIIDILLNLLSSVILKIEVLSLKKGSVVAETSIITKPEVKADTVTDMINKDPNIKAEYLPNTTTSPPSKPGLDDWAIAVIVICCVIVALLVILVVITMINRHKSSGNVNFHHVEMNKIDDDVSVRQSQSNIGYIED